MKRIRTLHSIRSEKISKPLRLAVASDIHSSSFDDVLADFAACDAVLIPGDLVDRHRKNNRLAIQFLNTVPDICPVFYSVGNHERKLHDREHYMEQVRASRVKLLDNAFEEFCGILIGGLSSAAHNRADNGFLDLFENSGSFRLLMCHHPEMYRDHVSGRDIDFTVCGHAHGGQIQLFGRGLYAPGQGFLPKLTSGSS